MIYKFIKKVFKGRKGKPDVSGLNLTINSKYLSKSNKSDKIYGPYEVKRFFEFNSEGMNGRFYRFDGDHRWFEYEDFKWVLYSIPATQEQQKKARKLGVNESDISLYYFGLQNKMAEHRRSLPLTADYINKLKSLGVENSESMTREEGRARYQIEKEKIELKESVSKLKERGFSVSDSVSITDVRTIEENELPPSEEDIRPVLCALKKYRVKDSPSIWTKENTSEFNVLIEEAIESSSSFVENLFSGPVSFDDAENDYYAEGFLSSEEESIIIDKLIGIYISEECYPLKKTLRILRKYTKNLRIEKM